MRDPENNMSQGPRNRVEMMSPQNVTDEMWVWIEIRDPKDQGVDVEDGKNFFWYLLVVFWVCLKIGYIPNEIAI